MKTFYKTILIIFTSLGIIALILGWLIRQDNIKEKIFTKNCQKIMVGMTIQKASTIMQEGLNSTFQADTVKYDLNDKNNSIYALTYPIDGGSYLIHIYYDKKTGLVKEIGRPSDEWFKKK